MKKLFIKVLKKILRKYLNLAIVKATANADTENMLGFISGLDLKVETIVDIGASDGKWSLNAERFFKDAQFMLIEPLIEHKEKLTKICDERSNYSFKSAIASDTDRQKDILFVTPDLDGSTVGSHPNGVPREVATATIDRVLMEANLQNTNSLLKFDTHGHELPILLGCKHTLDNTVAIIMELYNFQLTDSSLRMEEMIADLNAKGFRLAYISDPTFRRYDGTFWQLDALFIRDEHKVFKHTSYK